MKNISGQIECKGIIRLKLVNSSSLEDNRTVLVPTLLTLGNVKALYFHLTTVILNCIKKTDCTCTDLLFRAY